MTYAKFKSMLYAGLKEDDPRVKAARRWMEGDPNLATTFCLLALSHCRVKPPAAN